MSSPLKAPPWLESMRAISGTHEQSGAGDNPTIMAWPRAIGERFPDMAAYCGGYTHDEIPWCGLTVAYVMAKNGIRPVFGAADTQRFLWARAWAAFGTATPPKLGAIMVFQRHVSLYESEDATHYMVRGGNQSDSVNLSRHAKSDLIASRWPPGVAATAPGSPGQTPVPAPGRRMNGIVATVFGGAGDRQPSAYGGMVDPNRPGCALPLRFPKPVPLVRIFFGGRVVVCPVVDVGPWNINDAYWRGSGRPLSETQRRTGTPAAGGRVPSNDAGIDLTPAAAQVLGLSGRDVVSWEFVGAGTSPGQSSAPVSSGGPVAAVLAAIAAGVAAVLATVKAHPLLIAGVVLAAIVLGVAALMYWRSHRDDQPPTPPDDLAAG